MNCGRSKPVVVDSDEEEGVALLPREVVVGVICLGGFRGGEDVLLEVEDSLIVAGGEALELGPGLVGVEWDAVEGAIGVELCRGGGLPRSCAP